MIVVTIYSMTEPTSPHKISLITDKTKLYYGVYSHEQEYKFENNKTWYNGANKIKRVRYTIYEKEDGTQVKITEVSQNPNSPTDHKKRFPDSEYLGNVVKWVKTVDW